MNRRQLSGGAPRPQTNLGLATRKLYHAPTKERLFEFEHGIGPTTDISQHPLREPSSKQEASHGKV